MRCEPLVPKVELWNTQSSKIAIDWIGAMQVLPVSFANYLGRFSISI
jgi:hypothetical protein